MVFSYTTSYNLRIDEIKCSIHCWLSGMKNYLKAYVLWKQFHSNILSYESEVWLSWNTEVLVNSTAPWYFLSVYRCLHIINSFKVEHMPFKKNKSMRFFLCCTCLHFQQTNIHTNCNVLFSFIATCYKNLVATWHQPSKNVVLYTVMQLDAMTTRGNKLECDVQVCKHCNFLFLRLQHWWSDIKFLTYTFVNGKFTNVFWHHSFEHTAKAWGKNLHAEPS
jgi:hypothetical protein